MSATVCCLRLPPAPRVGDRVTIRKDGISGYVERLMPNRLGVDAIAVVRTMNGMGARVVTFAEIAIDRAPDDGSTGGAA